MFIVLAPGFPACVRTLLYLKRALASYDLAAEVNAETCLPVLRCFSLMTEIICEDRGAWQARFKSFSLPLMVLTQQTSIHDSVTRWTCGDFVNYDHKPWSHPGF